ncbi:MULTISPECIES: D-glycero-alpha-D-manno-heptose-1,7-bisphosphate 7-phosphatase [unclassified Saccharicrinis]|uniref:D-glycero-alpha-D-manno-heptose-1,7-bisphosphate 7-phosphatase n=1 Tax=unclassified Saccharicrinis TaxID=2646859 RepID=UPI003D32BB4E
MNKAVFIDRDGVVNSDEGHYYIYRAEDFVFNPDIEASLLLLKEAGFKLVLVSNQGGVAKGEYGLYEVEKLHEFMQFHLRGQGAEFDAIYYCPHHDSIAPCECRKPKPGMIRQAIRDLNIDPSQSFLIGDSPRDIEAGHAAGLKACFKVKKNTSIYREANEIVALGNE